MSVWDTRRRGRCFCPTARGYARPTGGLLPGAGFGPRLTIINPNREFFVVGVFTRLVRFPLLAWRALFLPNGSRVRSPHRRWLHFFGGLVVSLFFGGAVCVQAETRSLFNGSNLEGWTTWLQASEREDPKQVFSVEEGCLRISGDGYGYLATTETFSNYLLTLEFRWGDQVGLDRRERTGKALDSGVFLHAIGPDGNSHDGGGAYMAAIECNLFEGASGDFLLIRGSDAQGQLIRPEITLESAAKPDSDGYPFWQPAGKRVTLSKVGRANWLRKSPTWRDVLGFRGPDDVEKAVGKWNRLECRCEGRSITITLNGQRINHVTQVFPSTGKILLQCEGAEIYFRNLMLTPLP